MLDPCVTDELFIKLAACCRLGSIIEAKRIRVTPVSSLGFNVTPNINGHVMTSHYFYSTARSSKAVWYHMLHLSQIIFT